MSAPIIEPSIIESNGSRHLYADVYAKGAVVCGLDLDFSVCVPVATMPILESALCPRCVQRYMSARLGSVRDAWREDKK